MRKSKASGGDEGARDLSREIERCDGCTILETQLKLLVSRVNSLSEKLEQIASAPKRPTRQKDQSSRPESTLVWEAYAFAYKNRHKVEPVRNAKVNTQLKNLVSRVGLNDATALVQFYVGLNDAWTVQHFHPLDGLLSKCEGYVTRMKAGVEMSRALAQKVETTSASISASQKYLERKYSGSK